MPARRVCCAWLLLFALAGCTAVPQPAADNITLLFSPQEDIEKVWVEHISSTRSHIHIACFGLSNKAIAAALVDAAENRHVEVIILEDHRQAQLSADRHRYLAAHGCHIIIKRAEVLLHDKLGIFDDQAAIIGSWNLSQSAEAQDNCVAVFDRDPAQAAKVEDAWERMFKREVRQDYVAGIRLPPVFPDESSPESMTASEVRHPQPAKRTPAAVTSREPSDTATQVWVNTRSGKYFLPGSRYYGETSEGAFMTEEEALASGYVAAK